MRISVMLLSKFWEKVSGERDMMWQKGRREKKNCGNIIVKIRREEKFAIVTIQLPKHERKSEKKFNNMDAEI